MNRIDRLLGLLTLLQSRKYLPAETIAATYGTSVRTVYRDIKALVEQGVPVSFEPGRGYFIVQGYFLPPVSFSTEEANALLLVERMVSGFADGSIKKHYSEALRKVRAVLRGHQKELVDTLDNRIHFQLSPCLVQAQEFLSPLQTAISTRRLVELDYQNRQSSVSRRKVEPIGLIFYAFGWHLIGWCHLRGEYRDFKVSRMLRAVVTEEPFTREDHLPLAEYMKQLPVAY